MTLLDIQNGQIVKYRLGRSGRNGVDWSEWKSGPMHVRRRDKKVTSPVVTLTPIEENWAEYDSEDFYNGVFTCEDYYLEIEGNDQCLGVLAMKLSEIAYAAVDDDGNIISTAEGCLIGDSEDEIEYGLSAWRLGPAKIIRVRIIPVDKADEIG